MDCIKEMPIETRWCLRQTSRSDRSLVIIAPLYADKIELHADYIFLSMDGKHVMINYKYNREKFLPLLTYLFSVMVFKQLVVDDYFRWFYRKICKKLPNGERSVQCSYCTRIMTLGIFSDVKLRRITRKVSENFNRLTRTYKKEWHLIDKVVYDWTHNDPEIGSELVVYDPFLKSMETFMKHHQQHSFVRGNYEEGLIGINSFDRIVLVYRKNGSHWFHLVVIPVESEYFVNTERWTDCTFFNFTKSVL